MLCQLIIHIRIAFRIYSIYSPPHALMSITAPYYAPVLRPRTTPPYYGPVLLASPQAVLCMIAVHYGDSKRLIHGYDSFGNVCNSANNKHIKGIAMSGMNTTGLEFVRPARQPAPTHPPPHPSPRPPTHDFTTLLRFQQRFLHELLDSTQS